MFDSLASAAWLWVPCTLFAAAAQTVRNAAQRTLTDEVGALSATLVRFLFGLPLTVAWVAFLYWGPGSTARLPDFNLPYLGWIGMGAFFQIFATAALLRAMVEENAQSYEHPEEVIRWYYAQPQRLGEVEGLVMESNVVEWVLGKAKVTDKAAGFDELMGQKQ